jgi:hypothetical protein
MERRLSGREWGKAAREAGEKVSTAERGCQEKSGAGFW